MMIKLAGPLTEFGPDAHGYFNVYDQKNESWPDVSHAIYALPFISTSIIASIQHSHEFLSHSHEMHEDFLSWIKSFFPLNHFYLFMRIVNPINEVYSFHCPFSFPFAYYPIKQLE